MKHWRVNDVQNSRNSTEDYIIFVQLSLFCVLEIYKTHIYNSRTFGGISMIEFNMICQRLSLCITRQGCKIKQRQMIKGWSWVRKKRALPSTALCDRRADSPTHLERIFAVLRRQTPDQIYTCKYFTMWKVEH